MSDTIEQTEESVTKKSSIKTPVGLQKVKKERKDKPVPWQRLFLSLTGLSIIVGMWRWAVYHLYSIPDHSVVAFTSITNNAFYVIGAIVVFMVTGKLIYDWKNETATTLVDQASHLTEHKKEDVNINKKEESTQTINQNVVVKEAGINAPELKPFGASAVGDESHGEFNDFER